MNTGQPILRNEQKPEQARGGSRRWRLIPLLGLLALAGAILAWWQWGQPRLAVQAQAQPTPAYQTQTVRRGSLSNSVSGSGNLAAATSIDLGFATPSEIGTLTVQPGDKVSKGQVLAVLSSINTLKLTVENNQLAVQTAQKALDDLQANAAQTLAQAQADQASAQAAVQTAQDNVHAKSDPTCTPSLTVEYYYKYVYQKRIYDQWQGYLTDPTTGYGKMYIEDRLRSMKHDLDIAQANWNFCSQGYTDQQVQQSQSNLQTAKANLDQATRNYQILKANGGIDPAALSIDQVALESAKLQLTKSQADLESAQIIAPMDGTIIKVNGQVGLQAPDGAVITLADLAHPIVQVNIDEGDLSGFAVGFPAQVTFSALPGKTYSGVVTRILPNLGTVQGASSAQGQVKLTNLSPSDTNLPLGLTASVQVTCEQANNVLEVPVQALYEPQGQPAYVYVLGANNTPEKRTVTVGMKTSTFAEIRSGLNEGERVITTPIQNP